MVELEVLNRVHPPDTAVAAESQRLFDLKTKPRRSLGGLEEIAAKVAGIRGVAVPPRLEAAIVVAAADHGVAAEGVSAYPQQVTAQMVANFAAGGAAINVLAREAGARLVVIDVGVVTRVEHPKVRQSRFGAGTANATHGPAMSRDQALAALSAGVGLAAELAGDGISIVGAGEMGIANTTSASALCASLLSVDPARVCGRGTGLDDDGVRRKADVVSRMLAANEPDPADPVGAVAALGGFEIGFLAGLVLGCAAERIPVVLDGFISSAAALVAARLAPDAVGAMIASHRSPEPGHTLILEALALEPIFDLGLRLGEGSGAALALPIIAAALALLREMASFADAGVTDAGR